MRLLLPLLLSASFLHPHQPARTTHPMEWIPDELSPALWYVHSQFEGRGMICGVVQPHQTFSGADKWGPGPLTRDWDYYTMKSGDAIHGRSGYNLTLEKAKAEAAKDCDR